ncbi:phage antirepressor N-terminal domain-containing protein [Acinetobacter soli]|uniref:phage antirepressor N-terminal domain-containing protein n=1 Tax=Acinetobacter soli TaxID=487316 RepID=UPI000E6ADF39|nr:phage antirepressor N-terminal domain-containing protein [Acinetobacter soli]
MTSLNQIAVPFHSTELYLVEHNGQPYTPMKPIVEGMGLTWQSQHRKLTENNGRWGIIKMMIPTIGDIQEMICMPLRKLLAWLTTISPKKVKPELRDTVIMYQNECDDVLWDYWTKGQAINSRKSISPEQQALLHEIVARRSGGERKVFAEMWARHNRHFKIPRYSELLTVHFPEAVHYLETMELKAKTVKQEVKSLPYPQEVMQIAKQISHEFKGGQFKNWLVTENNGLLSIQALAHGYYPTIDIAEFTKRFDNLLDLLYGSDTLRVGRHFLAERKQAKF